MSIKGLTDRGQQFPEIGRIKKGSPKQKNERGVEVMGKDLKYFRVEFDPSNEDAIKTFHEVYGEQPQAIRILLPFNEIHRMWDAYYEAYTAGRMIARADGERYLFLVNPQTGQTVVANGEPQMEFKKEEPVGFYFSQKKEKKPIFAKPIGRLRVIVPELRRLAYLTLQTTSIYDILNISSQLDAISFITNGHITGVPLILKRVPRMISCPSSDGQKVRREKWLISIEADPAWVNAKVASMNALSYPQDMVALLPSGDKTAEVPPSVQRGIDQSNPDEADEDWDPNADIEGDFVDSYTPEIPEEPAPQDEPQTRIDPIANNGHSRPYSADVLLSKFSGLVSYYADQNANATDGDKFAVRVNMELCWAGKIKNPSERRHDVTEYLTGKRSIDELTSAQILALKHWLGITRNKNTGEYYPGETAVKEAEAAWEAYQKSKGQLDIFDAPRGE
ncbi:MAG TPA: hypothetical protein DDW19_01375 [Anaerolineaceae bacterium]|nr:hypothetical protein [Anaerolineaceae bacterium]